MGDPLGRVQFNSNTLHDVRSISKSIVSLLIGIAIHEGTIPNVNVTLDAYLSDYPELTPDRASIRLKDLLSMSSGLKWDESTYPYGDTRNDEYAMNKSVDRVRYALSRPIETTPGKRFRYSAGDVELTAAVLTRATAMPLNLYAQSKLFQPLGVTEYEWVELDGAPVAASGLRLRPIDMAKIGRMMLDRGQLDGLPILPESWVTTSTSPKLDVDPSPSCPGMTQYGYYWWLYPTCTPPFIQANGNGGQRITIFDADKLVIVTTAGMYGNDTRSIDRLTRDMMTVIDD